MAEAVLYQTVKRKNSTLIPTGGTAIQVDLKGGCDLNEPVFLINFAAGVPPFSMIEFEGKFYFISSVRNVRANLFELNCTIDVLSTYKTQILSSSALVLYRDHVNTEIADTRIPAKTTAVYQTSNSSFDTLGSGGYTIVINVVGTNSIASYAMSEATALSLLTTVYTWYSNEDVSGVTSPTDSFFTDQLNAIKYLGKLLYTLGRQLVATGKADESIRSAYAIPIPLDSFGGDIQDVWLGNFNTGVQARRISERIFADGCELTIPWQATDWRRNSPYHELYLYIPYTGLVSMSPSDVMGYSSVHVSMLCDKSNGDAIFTVWVGDSKHVIGQYASNIGSTFGIGSSNVSPLQTGTSLTSAAAGVASLLGGAGAKAVAAGAVGLGLVNSINGQPTCISSNGGGAFLGMSGRCTMYSVFHDTIVSPANYKTLFGEPDSTVMSLTGLTGFVQTDGFSMAGAMTDDERELINNMMDGGVYIE